MKLTITQMEYRPIGMNKAGGEVHYAVKLDSDSQGVTAQVSELWVSQIKMAPGREINKNEVEELTSGAIHQYVKDHGKLPPRVFGISTTNSYKDKWQELIDLGKKTPLGVDFEVERPKQSLGFVKSR